jgi:hypothetical protein
LLLIADGPRGTHEIEKCREARDVVINGMDWDCELVTNISDVNMGLKMRQSSGMQWIFEECAEAIVLEDDTLPSESFFPYCQVLLERYRNDDRIMTISGCNFQRGRQRSQYGYFFSQYHMTWGWASWRRAFRYYDLTMNAWPAQGEKILAQFEDPYERRYWSRILSETYGGSINTWDYQWVFACWLRSGLGIQPENNLISNIGMGPDATNTTEETSLADIPLKEMWSISHPPEVKRNRKADAYTFAHCLGGRRLKLRDHPLWPACQKALRLGARIKRRIFGSRR